MQGKGLVVEAVSVEAVVAGDAPAEPRHAVHPPRELPRRSTVPVYSGGRWGRRAGGARGPAPRRPDSRAGHHRREERHHRGRARLGGEAHRTGPSGAGAPRGPRRHLRRRHHRRPGAAGGVQQPVHEHRRADGPAAAEHRLLGQHQGAARFQLCAVRCAGQPDRQRAAHAGAPGQHGREHQDRDPRERGDHAARRRVCAQRPLPRRHAPAGHHGHHAGVPRRGARCPRSTSAAAATTPTSAARRRARCRRSPRASRRRACRSTTSSWSSAACCARPRWLRCCRAGNTPAAIRRRTWPISGRRSPPTRKACRNCARWWTSSAWTWCRPTCAMCRTTPRSRCAASSRA